jgi:hypothetical protein
MVATSMARHEAAGRSSWVGLRTLRATAGGAPRQIETASERARVTEPTSVPSCGRASAWLRPSTFASPA